MSGGGHGRRKQEVSDWSGESCPQEVQRFQFFEISTVAAKICLEGYSVSTSALFFYEPSKATSYWIENNRPYLFTIGHHRFFS